MQLGLSALMCITDGVWLKRRILSRPVSVAIVPGGSKVSDRGGRPLEPWTRICGSSGFSVAAPIKKKGRSTRIQRSQDWDT
jgi:hypothetical protein